MRLAAKCGVVPAWVVVAAVLYMSPASARVEMQLPAAPARAPVASSSPDTVSVRIDAVVTDQKGRPVLDLRPSDFEVIEHGAPAPLTTVELRSHWPPIDGAAAPIESAEDEKREAGQPGTRVFALFLDEFHVAAGETTERVREAASRFVDEQLQTQDLALVMKPLDAVSGFRFSRDRTVLRAAIAGFSGRKDDLAPRSLFEEQYIGRAPEAIAAARVQIVTAGLRELTLRLGELQADRGVIVLLSEGFPAPAARGSRSHPLQGVVRAASHYHLSIYTFNPAVRTQQEPGPAAEARTATLDWLAAQTGGRAAAQGSDLAAGFDRMSADLAAYYALTYRPLQSDGRFHALQIRAKRRNADVRARPGYWAPLGGEWRTRLSAGMVPSVSRRALRRSPLIETRIGVSPQPGGEPRMVITWEPRPGTSASPRLVVLQARSTRGAELFNGDVAPVQAGTAASPDSARFDVPAGRVELDLSIRDLQGKVLDTEVRDFDVPDLRSRTHGPMLLFPEVVRTRTVGDFRSALANPDAAPSSLRVFARGDRLLIRVPAYDSSGAAVEVSARLLNEWGHPMRDIDAADGVPGQSVAQFALPLAWLGPGQYLIELAGTNPNGIVKERLAFRLTS